MSRPARITVLCEDRQQACFVRRFLLNRRWTRHDIREVISPPGRGSGESYVRRRFPNELKAYRSKAYLRKGLIVVLDADTREVADRVRALDAVCNEQSVDPAKPDERVLRVIPKRNIETWFAFLRGETVNETTSYRRYQYESDCHPDADKLDGMCRDGKLPAQPPPSLERCCNEFQDFWRLIR